MVEKPLFIKVTKAEYVKDYILRLTFNDGAVKLCDFLPLAQEGIFQKLKDLTYFKNFALDLWTMDWNNEIGFAPEYLYEIGIAA
jgi:hypothetical protein